MQTCSLEPVERVLFTSSPVRLDDDFVLAADMKLIRAEQACAEHNCLFDFLFEHPQFEDRLVRPVRFKGGTRYVEDETGRSMSHYEKVLKGLAK